MAAAGRHPRQEPDRHRRTSPTGGDAILAALEAIGRDPATFALTAQVPAGTTAESRREGLDAAKEAVRLGATHLIIGMPPRLGPAGVDDIARSIAEPLREAIG